MCVYMYVCMYVYRYIYIYQPPTAATHAALPLHRSEAQQPHRQNLLVLELLKSQIAAEFATQNTYRADF